jgi:hypothetical protein
MHMLLERAASFFQAQGFGVKVQPCVIGDSGAIHTPDLVLVREGARDRAVFVFEELAGHAPLEAKAAIAKDMGCAPVFVVGAPGDEVRRWAERHEADLLVEEELLTPGEATPPAPAAPPAPSAPAAPPAEAPPQAAPPRLDTDAEILAVSPSRNRLPEGPMTAFVTAPAEAKRQALPEDGGAMLLPGTPRAGAPAPRQPRAGRGVVQFPTEPPEDGDAMLLTPAPRAAPPSVAVPAPQAAALVPAGWADAPAHEGSELLPSMPASPRAADEGDKLAKHDLSIWNPAARLQLVKQAAKAQGFESTAPRAQPFGSEWLNRLRR